MTAAFISELRKLLTVRSTYAIMLFCIVLLGIFNFYGLGIKATPAIVAHDPSYLMQQVFAAVQNLGMLGALVGMLLVTHEYRYNTIVYSLTAANSRTKVLLAKIGVVTLYSIVFTAIMGVLAAVFLLIGVKVGGHELVPQVMYYHELIWRSFAFGWGMSMFALLIAALVRSQVAAIATFFLWPTLVENLATLVIHEKTGYLPFTALGTIVSGVNPLPYVGTVKAFVVVLATLAAGWIIAWALFLRRDAA